MASLTKHGLTFWVAISNPLLLKLIVQKAKAFTFTIYKAPDQMLESLTEELDTLLIRFTHTQ
jgi:hypothetical protein